MKTIKVVLLSTALSIITLLSLCSCSDTDDSTDYIPASTTVYVTKTGTKYHRESCYHLQRSKIEIELEDAKRKGYGPCSACDPPTEKDF